jgi:phosphatidylglycerol lysyltransferase
MSKRWLVPDGCTYAAGRDDLARNRLALAERLAFEQGEGYDSYLLLESGRQYFFGRGDCGVVGFSTWRNHAYVVGGLLAPPACKRLLLADFLDFARRNRLEVSFLNVLATDLEVFRERGFQVSKVGEEPIIDLDVATWQGGDFAWVRRQENFCVRQRVRCAEVDAPALPGLAAELHEVSHEHLGDTVYNRELSLMVGRVDLEHLYRKRVFVARREGRVEAFVVAAPARSGQLWAVETFRRRPNATRGVIPFLILQIARQLRDEGVRVLSLCQVPALRVHVGTPSDSRLVVNGLRFWWNWLPWFYDPPRLYHFKSRFRPQYRECFIATYPRSRFVPLFAFFFKWGVIWPSFARLPQQMLRRMRKWGHSERLADPDTESYVIVERLPAPDDVIPLLEEHFDEPELVEAPLATALT